MLRNAGHMIAGKMDELAAAEAFKMKMPVAAAVLMGVLVKHPLAPMKAAQLSFLRHAAKLPVEGAFAQRAAVAEGFYYLFRGVLLLLPLTEKIPQGFVLHGFIHSRSPFMDGIFS